MKLDKKTTPPFAIAAFGGLHNKLLKPSEEVVVQVCVVPVPVPVPIYLCLVGAKHIGVPTAANEHRGSELQDGVPLFPSIACHWLPAR